jgi:transcriptional regulator with XRE-family HTH domain
MDSDIDLLLANLVFYGMTPESLKAWRTQRNWTQTRAARELGISINGYGAYETGMSPRKNKKSGKIVKVRIRIPKTIGLACAAIANGIPPIS